MTIHVVGLRAPFAASLLLTLICVGCGSSHRYACLTTHSHAMHAPLLGRFTALGKPPVELDIGNGDNLRRGQVVLGRGGADFPGWHAMKTLWFTPPSYHGGFTIHAKRLDARGPAGIGSQPPGGSFSAPAGPTANMLRGWRNFPSSTWVRSPGCYEWQISGHGFNETIVVEGKAP